MKYVAFYLPQFHPIEENDKWWGAGFTEWTNVTTAAPLFPGHQQPRLPNGMGFYDARVPETRNAQFQMAREHGIDAFCYYYYWFNGRRLLNRPLDDVIEGKVDPFPFCICWANENWSRRWDGQENDILMSQIHTLESDIDFIHDVIPVLSSENYLKVDGKPILLIYRADRLKDARATTTAWREEARKAGLPGIHLAAVQSFGLNDVTELGFDVAVEFPPHFLSHYGNLPHNVAPEIPFYKEFKGQVYEYKDVVDYALSRPEEPYPIYRGLMCAWDNTARRKQSATVFDKPSPFLYERWLTELTRQATVKAESQTGDQLVFINAWNEWAEGSTLEPCTSYGKTFLMATSRSKRQGRANAYLSGLTAQHTDLPMLANYHKEPVLLVGHDAERNGAQINLLHFAQELKAQGVPVSILLLGDGPLADAYKIVAPTTITDRNFASRLESLEYFRQLSNRGYRRAITNTVATGSVVKAMKDEGFTVVSLIHELPDIIKRSNLEDHYGAITQFSDTIVYASKFIQNQTDTIIPTPPEKVVILPQGCYRRLDDTDRKAIEENPRLYWSRLGIPNNAKVIVGVGYGDRRKGMDIFADIAQQTYFTNKDAHFVWVGDVETVMHASLLAQMKHVGWRGNLHLHSFTNDVNRILHSADLMLLTSREDPFPTVVLEALDAGVPVVAFKDAGGIGDLASSGYVRMVRYLDSFAMQSEMIKILEDKKFRADVRREAPQLIAKAFNYEHYVAKINLIASPFTHRDRLPRSAARANILFDLPKVSVVVPNYNAGAFIKARLASVEHQTLEPAQVIVLDDASTDASPQYIRKYCEDGSLTWTLEFSGTNSGSPFLQWRKGLELCSNELVWIAESDDYASLDFIETLAPIFRDPNVVMAYAHSVPVGVSSERLSFNYDQYLAEVDPVLWKRSFKMSGDKFAAEYLTSLNTIPNASAVIFRRDAALKVINQIVKYRACGDWLFYFLMAKQGKVAFIPDVLNFHRRHGESVISRSEKDQGYIVELLDLAHEILRSPSGYRSLKRTRDLLVRIEGEYKRHRTPDMSEEIVDNEQYSFAYSSLRDLINAEIK